MAARFKRKKKKKKRPFCVYTTTDYRKVSCHTTRPKARKVAQRLSDRTRRAMLVVGPRRK